MQRLHRLIAVGILVTIVLTLAQVAAGWLEDTASRIALFVFIAVAAIGSGAVELVLSRRERDRAPRRRAVSGRARPNGSGAVSPPTLQVGEWPLQRDEVFDDLRARYENATRRDPRSDRPLIILIHGQRGLGKHTLAQRLAVHIQAERPDLRQLGGYIDDENDSAKILHQFLRTLGEPADHIPVLPGERRATYKSLTATRRHLVVMVGVGDRAQIEELLPNNRDSVVIATSTRPLLPGSQAVLFQAELPDEAAAARMLRTESGVDTWVDPDVVARVVRQCGRLPLALAAAARLAQMAGPEPDLRRVADALHDPRHRLTELSRAEPGVRSSIAAAYRRLTGDEQRALRLLNEVSTPTFHRWVLQPLMRVDVVEATNLLRRLTSEHLLKELSADATGAVRYTLAPLVDSFLLESRPQNSDEQRAALERLESAYLAAAQQVLVQLGADVDTASDPLPPEWSPGPEEWARQTAEHFKEWKYREYAALIGVVETALRRGLPRTAHTLMAALGDTADDSVHPEQVLGLYARVRVLDQDRHRGSGDKGPADLAWSYQRHLLRTEEYRPQLMREAGLSPNGTAVGERPPPVPLWLQGTLHWRLGNYRQAGALLQRADVGSAHHANGELWELVQRLGEDVHMVKHPRRPSGGPEGDGTTIAFDQVVGHLVRARIDRGHGDFDGAREHLGRQRLLHADDPWAWAPIVCEQAETVLTQARKTRRDPAPGEVSALLERVGLAHERYRSAAHRPGMARAQWLIAWVLLWADRDEEAERHCDLAEESLAAMGESRWLLRVANGDPGALRAGVDRLTLGCGARVLRLRGEIRLRGGDHGAARSHLQQARRGFNATADTLAGADTAVLLGEALHHCGRYPAAMHHFWAAVDAFQECGDTANRDQALRKAWPTMRLLGVRRAPLTKLGRRLFTEP